MWSRRKPGDGRWDGTVLACLGHCCLQMKQGEFGIWNAGRGDIHLQLQLCVLVLVRLASRPILSFELDHEVLSALFQSMSVGSRSLEESHVYAAHFMKSFT